MKKLFINIVGGVLLILHILSYYSTKGVDRRKIDSDVQRWKKKKMHEDYSKLTALIWALLKYPEFRTLFYHRIGKIRSLFCKFLPGRTNLYIMTPSSRIGGGLYIGHGWGTVINADEIGDNCLVAQNVTIGSRKLQKPKIKDGCNVWAHAVVLGGITIGANSEIGSGAVVVKDVPDSSVVIPSKPHIIRQGNQYCNIAL